MSTGMYTARHTAPALHIGKLRTRMVSGGELDDAQVRQWHDAFAEQDPADLVGRLVADEEWLLIRHLPLHLRWRPESAAPEVGRAWLQALQVAVQQAAAMDGAQNVLRYRAWRHGLTDLLYRSAQGETHRQWAWHRMGLIDREGLTPADALLQGAHALLTQPDLIWPVLHHCLQAERDTGAFTALARRLPLPMWMRWMQAAPQSREWMRAWQAMSSIGDAAQAQEAPSSASAHAQDHASDESDAAVSPSLMNPSEPGEHAQALLPWARRHPSLARPLSGVISVWLAALTGAAPGAINAAGRRLRTMRGHLQQITQDASPKHLMRPSSRALPDAMERTSQQNKASHEQAASRGNAPPSIDMPATPIYPSPIDLPEAPNLPEPDRTLITAWAGALFCLRLLCQPDVMPTLHAQAGTQPDAPADTTALMQAVALALHVPIDDPVMCVMTAGQPLQAISPRIQAAANRLTAQWAQWLDDTLPDAPEPRLQWVCQRPGCLQIEPGWIELHLDMNQIDTCLRRIGLDLDPGWVPIIGAVVRICYD